MEDSEQAVVPMYHKKTKLYYMSKVFKDFEPTYKQATPYRKFTMVLNFFLPGIGNALVGAIEIGIIIFLLFFGLLAGTIYLGIVIGSGKITTTAITNVVIFALLAVGMLTSYYSSFRTSVISNHKLNEGNSINSFVIYKGLKKLVFGIGDWFKRIGTTYKEAKSKDKTILLTSFFVMGIPMCFYKQFLKGVIYFLIQFLFIFYMIARGASDLVNFFVLNSKVVDPLVYGVISLIILIGFIIAYFKHITTVVNLVADINESRSLLTPKQELYGVVNDKFYVTSLVIPILGALVFTIVPLAFMILVAFTNYSYVPADGYNNFDVSKNIFLNWVGLETFRRVFTEGANLQDLLSVFSWTMIWAAVATFSCYFGGLFLAMLLNKKCVKPKILYRSLFVVAMAMPQFVSLLIMRTMFDDYGPLNNLFLKWGWISEFIPYWEQEFSAKVLILVINMWVGIPYYMLLTSGLLINIPNDYYEAASIEGASKWQQFKRITFPNIIYMTTPLLITQFVSNINNFNVIYFLTNGGSIAGGVANTAYSTDILITWLYSLTMKRFDYNFGAAIGIIMFIISATISLLVFRRSKAYNNEEAFR